MLKIVKADITDETEGVIVSGCNLSGANGTGLAGALKAKWPVVYDRYMKKYDEFVAGDIPVFDHLGEVDFIQIDERLWVVNAFTQKHYGYDGKRYADEKAITKALFEVAEFCTKHSLPLKTVKIGCDRGGLSWSDEIRPVFQALQIEYPDLDITIFEW